MSGGEAAARKQAYFTRLIKLLDEFNKIILVQVDHVGSRHMQQIRIALRDQAVVLMGKNTMVRKAVRGHLGNNPTLEPLLPHIRGNIGFIFTKQDLAKIKKVVESNKVQAPAKAGTVAPIDVFVPAGNTGLEPTKTSFLQALNIGSKITRGQIEILNDVHLVKKGERVGTSEATLLQMLSISPFQYGLKVIRIFDSGNVFEPHVLDITDEDIISKFQAGVKNVASLSLQIGYPTLASLPHSVVRGYKNVLAVALGTSYSFPAADQIKEFLANPTKATKKAPSVQKTKPGKDTVEVAPEEEEAELGLGMFDDGGGDQNTAKKEKGGDKKKEKEKEKEPPAEEEEDIGLGLFD